MHNDFETPFDQDENQPLIDRYEHMVSVGELYFFDVEEFEVLIDHYFNNQNLEQALSIVDLAKSQHPFSMDLSLREAEILAYSNRTEEALQSLEKVELVEKNNPDIFITKANIYSQAGYYHKAIDSLQQAVTNTSLAERDELYLSLAFEYQNLNDLDKAMYFVKKSLEINPDNVDALYELAYCCEIADVGAELAVYLHNYLDENPYSADAWFLLGNAYMSLDEPLEAVDAYDFALAIHDDFISANFNKANALVKLERYKDAIEAYESSLYAEIGSSLVYYYIGDCYLKLLDFEQAIAYYQKSVQEDEEFSDAWLAIGNALDLSDRTAEAVHYIKKAINLDIDNAEYWYVLANCMERLGHNDESKNAYEKAIELNPTEADFVLDYADALQQFGELEEAIALLGSFKNQTEMQSEIDFRLAALYFEISFLDESIYHLNLALMGNPQGYETLFVHSPNAQNHPDIIELINYYNS